MKIESIFNIKNYVWSCEIKKVFLKHEKLQFLL